MSQHRKHRGMRTQKLVADYMRENGWPFADSAGAGRQGVDITGTVDLAIEVKARADLSPLAWVRQAEAAAGGRLPFAVFRPNGMGETPERFLAMIRFGDLVALLRAAGYGDGLGQQERPLERDLSDFHAERVSQVPPTPDRPLGRDWVAYCDRLTREAALRAVPREDEDDE